MVRTGGPGPKGISCVLVEKGTPGLSFGKKEQKLGWNSQPTAMLHFEDCRIPVANRIGAEGEGFTFAMAGLDGGRVNIGACSLGGARAALTAARSHMETRKQFGKSIIQFPAVYEMLSNMKAKLDASRTLLYETSRYVDIYKTYDHISHERKLEPEEKEEMKRYL